MTADEARAAWPHLTEDEAKVVSCLMDAATLTRMALDLAPKVEEDDNTEALERSLPSIVKKLNQLWQRITEQG